MIDGVNVEKKTISSVDQDIHLSGDAAIENQVLLKDTISVALPTIEIMDIGAMFEDRERYFPLVSQGLGRVTGFEPNSESLEKLKKRRGPYKYLPYFLGNGEVATFHRTRYPGCSSLLEPNDHLINLFTSIGTEPELEGNFEVVETMDVKTQRLDDIHEIETPDYIKIDVQGAELLIMEYATNTMTDTLVLETEVEFVPIYKNQPLFGDIQKFLVERGFILHKLVDIGGRTLRPITPSPKITKSMSQVLWADAIFIRDYSNLGAFDDEQLLKASLILNDIYMSYDVVLYMLSEYDRRCGSNLKSEYTKTIENIQGLKNLYMNLKEEF